MAAPIYHSYNPESGIYLGPMTAAIDPLETESAGEPVYMAPPAHAVADAPLGAGANQVDVYSEGWQLAADHRGHEYYLADGSHHTITEIGIEPPAEALTQLPVTVRLFDAKAEKLRALKEACSNAIRAGIYSDALGSSHHYDTDKEIDQINLVGAGLAGVDILYTCTEVSSGIKAQRLHTAAHINQVFKEAAAEKVRLLGVLYERAAQLEAVEITTTIEVAQAEIETITWTG
ncbi:DUF4376 domain-containing protein [Candidatus Vondammii sp. HM_W22]|uniref:DUF4376 domain-containing protein n=1 Tax=Candidatus Vondammii sp. HM_W22 TaxID=2687299 RepID=UPI001F14441D|nr:hypothetical protein [Candidatus Vondammii sp. HM_W22]